MAYYDASDLKSFAEKLGNGIVDVGREVVDKAKQAGDTAGLNLKVLEKERQLEKMFFELGVEYFQEHKDNAEDEYLQMERIRQMQCELRALREEIATRKGKEVCNQCGEFVDEWAKFCPNCGEKLTEE